MILRTTYIGKGQFQGSWLEVNSLYQNLYRLDKMIKVLDTPFRTYNLQLL